MRLSRSATRVRLLGLLVAWLAAGCNHAPPLPDDLARAQAAERSQDPQDTTALADYEAIVAGCRQHPRSAPKDPCGTAALRRAQQLQLAGRSADAAAAFVEVRSLSTDGRTIARALVRAALLYADPLKQPAEALRLCREVIPRWPDEVPAEDALRLLVDLETEARDPGLPDELGRLAEELRDHEVLGGFALFYRARLLARGGRPAEALAAYDNIWQRFPRGPLFDDSLMEAAKLLRGLHRGGEAAERLERLESSFQTSLIVGHYNKLLLDEGALLLGEIYLTELGQPDKAIAALDRLLRRQKTSLLCDDALLLMAEAALRRHSPPTPEDTGDACRFLARLRREYPDGNRVRRAAEMQAQLRCPESR